MDQKKKHTPGPWFYEEDDHTWMLFGGNGVMPMQLAKCPKKGSSYAEYWPEEADARLIAAAPELLELVKRYVADTEIECWNVPYRKACLAAIEKVEGQP